MVDAVPFAGVAGRFDWSHSALGATATWPPALRLAAAIMFNTPMPMLLCWGPQRAVLFNEAYADLADASEGTAPGGTVPALAPSPLAAGHAAFEQALAGTASQLVHCPLRFAAGGATYDADLHFTPVRLDNGDIGGVLCAVAPAKAATPAAADTAADTAPTAAATPGSDKSTALRILVVEDNLDSQFLVCEMLSAFGHDNAGVAHAEGALQELESGSFNVLFTDVSLPGMSGVELARRARARDPRLQVIFASGYGDALLRQIEFPYLSLQKPYELEQLQRALADVAAKV